MIGTLRHRGPDNSGSWADPGDGVALGHARLSILDLSSAGHQPMESPCGRYLITFNGEIYNFRALRRELEALGQSFRGTSDTEVLLGSISEWGLFSALNRFNGMFAFAVWDRQERLLHLARDRFGEKPLYYGWAGRTFAFASELKALKTHPGFDHSLDRDALALYMRFGYFPAPYSIYRSASKVMPGSVVTVDISSPSAPVRARPYWSLQTAVDQAQNEPFMGTEREAVDRLATILRQSVVMRMESDVPLGAFLSGGIDSPLVVALMQEASSRPIRTFSIGFREATINEATYARSIAAHLGTDHTELYVEPGVAMDVIPRLPTMYDEPLADSSQIPTFLVSQMARRSVTVALTGDGGDELFAGYDRYRSGMRLWGTMQHVALPLRRAAAAVVRSIPDGVADTGYEALSSVSSGRPRGERNSKSRLERLAGVIPAESPEAMYRIMASHCFDPTSFISGAREHGTVFTELRRWTRGGDAVTRMTYLDAAMNLPDEILAKVDRASMAVGLETRVPFLDHHVAEFAWSLPTSLKIRNGRGKSDSRDPAGSVCSHRTGGSRQDGIRRACWQLAARTTAGVGLRVARRRRAQAAWRVADRGRPGVVGAAPVRHSRPHSDAVDDADAPIVAGTRTD